MGQTIRTGLGKIVVNDTGIEAWDGIYPRPTHLRLNDDQRIEAAEALAPTVFAAARALVAWRDDLRRFVREIEENQGPGHGNPQVLGAARDAYEAREADLDGLIDAMKEVLG